MLFLGVKQGRDFAL